MGISSSELQHIEDGVKTTARALEEIPFVEFTTTLIRGVVETIVDSSIEQMEAYADLFSIVAAGLQNYQSKFLGEGTDLVAKIDDYLKSTFGFSDGDLNSGTVSIDDSKHAALDAVFSDLFIEEVLENTGNYVAVSTLSPAPSGLITTDAHEDGQITFAEIQVPQNSTITLSLAVLRGFAVERLREDSKASFNQLETLLKMGWTRLVFKKVKLGSKLTYHLDSTELQSESTSTVDQDVSGKSTSWGVNAFFRSGGVLKNGKRKKNKRLASGVISRTYGGAISGGIQSNKYERKLKVSVMNEKASAATNLNIDILGYVEIEAETDYYPSFDSESNAANA